MASFLHLNNLPDRLNSMLESIISLKHTISNAHTSAKSSKEDEAVLQQQKKDFREKTQMYNRLFQEEEVNLQQNGGKTRQDTLQEYMLTFFFLAYAIFLKALFSYVYVYGGYGKAMQITAIFTVMIIPVIFIMVKYM
jgi:hypothetical protein